MIKIEPTPATWYILISALIVVFAMFLFLFFMIRQLYIKRTIGTVMLTIFYFFLSMGEMTNTAGLWYYSYKVDGLKISGYLELTFVLFYAIGYIFLYFFLSRYFLKDNDLIKSFISILLTAHISIMCSFMYSELFYDSGQRFFTKILFMEGTNIEQVLPSFLSGLLIFLPIFLVIHIRMIIQLIIIQKDITSKEEKYGLRFIILSLLCFILAAFTASTFTLPDFGQKEITIIVVHTLRIVLTQLGLLLGYFGWIYPDWIRKRIKEKDVISE